METGIEEAVLAYIGRVAAHECTNDEECTSPRGFYLIGFEGEDGNLALYSGGHKASPILMAESVVGIIDTLVAEDDTLDPTQALMKSRDIVHSAANSIQPPPDASAALSDFLKRLGLGGNGE